MTDDVELLRRYAEDRSEESFAELVRRNLSLVYSVALRRVGGDAHLADDVTQRVFTDLARKAHVLAHRQALAGWLFTSARFAAAETVRRERRRQAHEQDPHTMQTLFPDSGSGAEWDRLRPVLDDLPRRKYPSAGPDRFRLSPRRHQPDPDGATEPRNRQPGPQRSIGLIRFEP